MDGVVLPTLRRGLLSSVNPFGKHSETHPEVVSMAILRPTDNKD